ncbi:amino acid ABC transporter permease [Amycolatopsis anabasis]|uniref:amino acid ABC transporter permease n=1 Tax=Amycolatopsis anabasis TaxID=1840409 RepID=UPI00131D3D90|nr:amino acid ABC transporter permease [Amycolatopsis anabasis]
MSVLFDHGGEILDGFYTTLLLTVCAYPLALVLGSALAICRISPVRPLRIVGGLYVDIVRNSPLLLIVVLIIFGLPDAGLLIPLFWCLVLGLGIYFGAYVCETVRAGIRAVDRGQVEAARAIGLPFRRVVTDVLLPQAFRAMVQPLGTILINTALGSALGAAVGVAELTLETRSFNLDTAEPILAFVVAACGYLAINLVVSLAIRLIERRARVLR